MNLKLYSVSDEYINYLRKYDNKVYDNKVNNRKKSRKYLGVLLKVNEFNYFIPLSSPKNSDYINGNIRNNTLSIIRICNGKELFGTLRISNMIPVPDSEIEYYDTNLEKDMNYKLIVLDELRFINTNSKLIINSAKSLYFEKKNKLNRKYLENTVDFDLLEKKCNEWINEKQLINA